MPRLRLHSFQHADDPTWCVHCGTFKEYAIGKCSAEPTGRFDSGKHGERMWMKLFGERSKDGMKEIKDRRTVQQMRQIRIADVGGNELMVSETLDRKHLEIGVKDDSETLWCVLLDADQVEQLRYDLGVTLEVDKVDDDRPDQPATDGEPELTVEPPPPDDDEDRITDELEVLCRRDDEPPPPDDNDSLELPVGDSGTVIITRG